MRKRLIHIGIPSAILLAVSVAVGLIGQDTTNMGRTYTGSQNVRYVNEGGTGTTLNKLAKLTGAPSTAIITATVDTSGIVGIVVAGAGAAGSADIAFSGKALCVFDSATTAGHYVQNDTSTAGDCMDAGASYPTSGQVIGVVTSTNGGAGTYEVDLTLRQPQAGGAGGAVIGTGTYGALPAPSTAGNLYLPSDGPRLYRDSGAAQVPWGPIFPLADTPAAVTFTAVNGVAGATLTDSQGGLYLKCDAAGAANKRLWVVAQPARPYTITMAVMLRLITAQATGFGMGWRDSNTGRLVLFQVAENAASPFGRYVALAKWTNPTTFSANYSSPGFSVVAPVLWLRITDTGVNFQVFHSLNGITWEQFDINRSRTDFLAAPDQWLIWAENQTATQDVYAYILSLVQS